MNRIVRIDLSSLFSIEYMIIHIRGVNLQIRKMKTIVSTSISPVNMKH